eukprot:CAMPEP_0168823314 /NCGR_PEP_ID=MMETSP0726-20121227/10470_1 /TAXON_ID=265536 /ORGANISM="Amphiprora sp., Strain CCMP467" /LENGTH=51 /DNA_ID=CAMNT_0008876191 /DNA_START=42 /DNA_END=198 /DNA_ORIENTATION=+
MTNEIDALAVGYSSSGCGYFALAAVILPLEESINDSAFEMSHGPLNVTFRF